MVELRWWVRWLLIAFLAVSVARIGVAALGSDRSPVDTIDPVPPSVPTSAPLDRAEFDSLLGVLRVAAPFQPSRSPGMQMAGASEVDPSAPRASRPVLQLGGVIGGRTPMAVLYGVPGTQGGRVVQEGDTIGGLRIRSIRGGTVSVTGYDTVWMLRLKETS